jgi:hypothetical protein
MKGTVAVQVGAVYFVESQTFEVKVELEQPVVQVEEEQV